MVWKGDGEDRLAKSLVTLIDDIVAKFPERETHHDGTIGDARHKKKGSDSDHNPYIHRDGMGIVRALDITHDPEHGFDAQAFADSLREQKDPRIRYIIFNGRIANPTVNNWKWRERNKGPGDHSEHVHISVSEDPGLYDDPSPWTYDLSNATPGPNPVFPPELERGDTGPAVVDLQSLLGITEDGDFGEKTEEAVRAFQARNNLVVDGIVGSHTWEVLKASSIKLGGDTEVRLAPAVIDEIVKVAAASSLADVPWDDRGRAPPGYIKGMAVTFGQVYAKLKANDSAVRLMAAQNSSNAARDALALYDSKFHKEGMDNSVAGPATLRHLFVLLIGLGMRESSGKYNEGRDMSADNTAADTAEAGLFQMSWNARSASSELPRLFALYSKKPDGFLSIFQEGVKPKETPIIGAGEGAAFQRLCKSCPAFAAEAAAIGLRVLCRHWGPIKRDEVEIRPEADALLKKVQEIVDAMQPIAGPSPGPTPPVSEPKPIGGLPIVIPPIGSGTMNPFILIAARVFPEILKAVVGDKAGTITGVLTKVITDVTQAKTPEGAKDKLNADPEAFAKLQLELAKIADDYDLARRKAELELLKEQNQAEAAKREADLKEIQAQIEDTKGARSTFRELALANNPMAWGAPAVSIIVTIGFFGILISMMAKASDPPTNISQLINISVGALAAGFATVISFWLGSSQGSRFKDAANAEAQEKQAKNTKELIDMTTVQTTKILEKSAQQAEARDRTFQTTIETVMDKKGTGPAAKSSSAIERCLDVVMKYEADSDAAGERRFGISVEELRAIRNLNHLTMADLQKLTPEQAREIYRVRYWNPLRCDDLPAGVDLVMLDFGVASGLTVSAERLQQVVGAKDDGAVGPATLAATKAMAVVDVITKVSKLRREYDRDKGSLDDRRNRRISAVEDEALVMARTGNSTVLTKA